MRSFAHFIPQWIALANNRKTARVFPATSCAPHEPAEAPNTLPTLALDQRHRMPVGLQLLARSDEIVVSNWLVAGIAGVRHGFFPLLRLRQNVQAVPDGKDDEPQQHNLDV